MTRLRKWGAMTAVLAASVLLGGCGRSPNTVDRPSDVRPSYRIAQVDTSTPAVPTEQAPASLKSLNLTDAQRDQLALVRAKYWELFPDSEREQMLKNLQNMLTDDSVDAGEVNDYLQELEEAWVRKAPRIAAIVGEARDVLSDEQRAKLIGALSARLYQPPRAGALSGQVSALAAALDLNEAQTQAMSALSTRMLSARQSRREAMQEATIIFLLDGDQAAYAAALKRALTIGARRQGAEWIATLSQPQRVRLFGTIRDRLEANVAALKARAD